MKQIWLYLIVALLIFSSCKKDSSSPTAPTNGNTEPKIIMAQLYVGGDTTVYGSTTSHHDSSYYVAAYDNEPYGRNSLSLGLRLYDATGHDITNQITNASYQCIVSDTTVATVSSTLPFLLRVKQPPFGVWWTKHLSVYALVYENGDTIKSQIISNIIAKPWLYGQQYQNLTDIKITTNIPWIALPYLGVSMDQVGDSVISFEVDDLGRFRPTSFGDGPGFHFQSGSYSLDGSWSSYTQASGILTTPNFNNDGTQFPFTLQRYIYTGPSK